MQKAYTKNAEIKGKNVVTDYYLEKGDYVKLDMLSLGYTWPVKSHFLESVKFSFTAKNLATFTRYSGVDPSSIQTNGLTPVHVHIIRVAVSLFLAYNLISKLIKF